MMAAAGEGHGAARHRRAWRFGRAAEFLCAWVLRLGGYRILATRFRSIAGEIDVVARRGRVLVFVEVKARGDAESAVEAVVPHQRRRIERAAQAFAAARRDLDGLDWRFDVMVVAPWAWPRHLKDAWRPD